MLWALRCMLVTSALLDTSWSISVQIQETGRQGRKQIKDNQEIIEPLMLWMKINLFLQSGNTVQK